MDLDRLLTAAVKASGDGITLSDIQHPDEPCVYVNPAFERLTGYSADEILGRKLGLLQGRDRDQPARKTIRQAIDRRQSCTVVIRNYRKDGTLFWNELSLSPVPDAEGHISHYLGIQKDITERIQSEAMLRAMQKELTEVNERLRYQASHDHLTELSNRQHFESQLNLLWKQAARQKQPLGILMIDVDHFKHFNDRYGHQAGDLALQTIARAFQSALKRGTDLVARYGGEEFIAAFTAEENAAILKVAEDLRQLIEGLIIELSGNRQARLTISIGAAYGIPHDGLSPEKVIHRADLVLYEAKEKGRNRVESVAY